ncbi:hypothetical protein K6V25_13455 [Bacteroides salyersiae]|uniref:hypothetical protein n=1 Tax=Bacteroides salyersiae TaxID=291644 RepID=UPI001CCED82F|nr:hypothetical protein [Bacteroides salyersiae]UBD63955.1 hypothetical protein K6V25_13455 [Bacteroides salyersiae]
MAETVNSKEKPIKQRDDQSSECIENCSYYINKKRLHLYKNKFLYSIISCTLAIIALFALYHLSYSNSQDKIVEVQEMFYDNLTNKYLKSLTLTKDSTISLDQVVIDIVEEKQKESLSLLELQYNKLQHDFTILSLWAGILMIVFLIFSIYSMFKVDEMQKQGRDYLNTMEGFSIEAKNISDSIEDKANEEISSLEERTTKAMNGLSTESKKQLDDLKNTIDKLQSEFESSVKTKTREFEKTVETYKKELKQSSDNNNLLFQQLFKTIKETDSISKQ